MSAGTIRLGAQPQRVDVIASLEERVGDGASGPFSPTEDVEGALLLLRVLDGNPPESVQLEENVGGGWIEVETFGPVDANGRAVVARTDLDALKQYRVAWTLASPASFSVATTTIP